MKNSKNLTPSTGESNMTTAHEDFDGYLVLNNGVVVLKTVYEYVQQQAETRIHELDKHIIYTSKQLCGKEFWDGLDRGEKIAAGCCIASMVGTGVLPLEFVPRTHEYPYFYRIK